MAKLCALLLPVVALCAALPQISAQSNVTDDNQTVQNAVVSCPNLTLPNGVVSFTMGTLFASKASFTCLAGFFLSKSSTTVCRADGTWSAAAPTCQKVKCPPIRSPKYGTISKGSDEINAIRRFTCNTGYSLVGDTVTVCMHTGKWSCRIPKCKVGQTMTTPSAGCPTRPPKPTKTRPPRPYPPTVATATASGTFSAGAIGFAIAVGALGLVACGVMVYRSRNEVSADNEVAGAVMEKDGTIYSPHRSSSTAPLAHSASVGQLNNLDAVRAQQIRKMAGF